jgi:hypothetical protein
MEFGLADKQLARMQSQTAAMRNRTRQSAHHRNYSTITIVYAGGQYHIKICLCHYAGLSEAFGSVC